MATHTNGPTPADIQVAVLADGLPLVKKPLYTTHLEPLGAIVERIRVSPTLKTRTDALRVKLTAGDKVGYKTDKDRLPAIIPAARPPAGTAVKGLPAANHNGLYGFDIDEGDFSTDEARQTLISAPGCVLVASSAGGTGLWAVYAGPQANTAEGYKRLWAAINALLPGGLTANSGKQSKNLNRLRFVAHDPKAWLASSPVEPLRVVVQQDAASAPLAPPPTSPHDEHSVDLDALLLVPPPPDYNDWVGWVTTLKGAGFSEAEVDAWSAASNKYKKGEVAQRWAGLPHDSEQEARNKLRGHAYNLGWRRAPAPLGEAHRPILGDSIGAPQPSESPPSWEPGNLDLGWTGERIQVPSKSASGLLQAITSLGLGLRYNIRGVQTELRAKGEWTPLNDRVFHRVREVLKERFMTVNREGERFPLVYGPDALKGSIEALLYDREVDPFLEWLEGLPLWDRTPRLDAWLDRVFVFNQHHPLVTWVSRFMFLGAVCRTYEPGCKLDEVPVLISKKVGGQGKSTAVEHILPDQRTAMSWFGILNISHDVKTRVEAMQGRVVVEIGEMAGATKGETSEIKTFVTQTDDGTIRLSWRHNPEKLLRRCIFVGTSDQEAPLPDDDNNRRWVPVTMDDGNPEVVRSLLAEQREQLWAEARELCFQGTTAFLPKELYEMQVEATKEARSRNQILTDKLMAWVSDGREAFTLGEAAEGIGMTRIGEAASLSRGAEERLKRVLSSLEFERSSTRKMVSGVRDYRYYCA